MKKSAVLLAVFVIPAFAALAQNNPGNASGDPSALIGTTIAALFENYGPPKSVYAVRGLANWQDDVVFVYDGIECYVYGNRVWQVKVPAAYNIKEGDPKAQVLLVLGETQDYEGYSLYELPGRTWPLRVRLNWDAAGRVAAIYIYRPDF